MCKMCSGSDVYVVVNDDVDLDVLLKFRVFRLLVVEHGV